MQAGVKKLKLIVIRVDRRLYDLLKKVVEARGKDISSFGRRAIKKELTRLNYLSDEEKKALGLRDGND